MPETIRCDEVEAVIPAYVDGSTAGPACERLLTHLARCAICQRKVEAERFGREILRQRYAAPRAPAALRARVADTWTPERAAAPRVVRGRFAGSVRLPALAAGLAALIVLGVIGIEVARPSPTAVAAQLALDHVKCFVMLNAPKGPADAEALSRWLANRMHYGVEVPPGDRVGGIVLLGGRRCLIIDGHVAHILYEDGGQMLSLFVLSPSDKSLVGPPRAWRFKEYNVLMWQRDSQVLTLVSASGPEELRRIAAKISS